MQCGNYDIKEQMQNSHIVEKYAKIKLSQISIGLIIGSLIPYSGKKQYKCCFKKYIFKQFNPLIANCPSTIKEIY